MTTRARVLLADDHLMVAAGLRGLIDPEFELVDTVADGRAMVERALALKPDVVIADISMPLLNGIDAVRQLRRADPSIPVVFLTMHGDIDFATLHDTHPRWNRRVGVYLRPTADAFEVIGIERESDPPQIGM